MTWPLTPLRFETENKEVYPSNVLQLQNVLLSLSSFSLKALLLTWSLPSFWSHFLHHDIVTLQLRLFRLWWISGNRRLESLLLPLRSKFVWYLGLQWWIFHHWGFFLFANTISITSGFVGCPFGGTSAGRHCSLGLLINALIEWWLSQINVFGCYFCSRYCYFDSTYRYTEIKVGINIKLMWQRFLLEQLNKRLCHCHC